MTYALGHTAPRIFVGEDVAEDIELPVTDLSVTLVLDPRSNKNFTVVWYIIT